MTIVPSGTTASSPQLQPSTVEYRLLPAATRVSFTTRHLFGLGAVAGTVRLVGGRMVVRPTTEELVLLEAELDMASFASGSRARDRAVTSARFLDVESHPTATYRAEVAERTATGWRVRGALTVKGLSAPVDLAVSDLDPSTAVEAHAVASVDRFAFGLAFPAFLASRRLAVTIRTAAERRHA